MIAPPPRAWLEDLLLLTVCGVALLGLVLAFVGPTAALEGPAAAVAVGPGEGAELDALAAEVDALLLPAELEAGTLERADTLSVARRVSLALTGTLPSLEELRALEAQPASEALAWWVDTRLADRRYADYFAERFARALVGTEDGSLILYRRRRFVAWLADTLATNQAWDAVTREMLSGTGLWTQQPGTNFITAAIPADGDDPDAERLAGRVSRVFLAQRLDCAQCHDHPFDPRWTQRDFQGLAAFFAPAELSLRGLREGAGGHDYDDPAAGERRSAAPSVPFLPELLPAQGPERERLARWLTHPDNPAFARATVNRVWALLFAEPLVEPLDDIPVDAALPPALDVLAADFSAHGYDLRRLIRTIARTQAFSRSSRPLDEPGGEPGAGAGNSAAPRFASFPLSRLRPEQVAGAVLQAASVATLDHESHALLRFARWNETRTFVERYGDAGEDELEAEGGTIPQRLLLLNGELVHERTKDNLIANASTRIAVLAPTDARAVELAYLAVLTRRPHAEEAAHFEAKLAGLRGGERVAALSDLYWVLLNTTEAAWNH